MAIVRNKQKFQEYALIAGAVGIIAASVVTTIFLASALSGPSADEQGGYQNTTFTDAVLGCEREMRDNLGEQLQSSILDDHSSRFEAKPNQYKIFLKAQLNTKSRANGTLQMYHINCYVNAESGRVVHYEQLEQKEGPTSLGGGGGGGGLFGWPK